MWARELGKEQDTNVWSVGDTAMSRICWAQDPSNSMAYTSPDPVEEQWVGHQFAIMSLSAFDEITRGRANWKDVSAETYKVLDEIWTTQGYGQGVFSGD